MNDPAVSVDGLVKTYGNAVAVNGISFDIAPGETIALLGPNGAGKTSTIEILEGYRARTAGNIDVLGFDPGRNRREFRERIGLVLQSTALEPELTVQETITAFSQFYPKPARIDGLLTSVGLADQRAKRVKTLSGGEQRRLEIALGLVGDPDVLFLDEPTTGLDPDARNGIWRMIQQLSGRGKTVILTSHNMAEVEALADRLAIMVSGEICAIGTVSEVVGLYGGNPRFTFWWPHETPPDDLPPSLAGAHDAGNNWIACEVVEPARALAELTDWARLHGVDLNHLTIARPSLEDIYLSIVDRFHHAGGDGT